jgi:hypothetical protein
MLCIRRRYEKFNFLEKMNFLAPKKEKELNSIMKEQDRKKTKYRYRRYHSLWIAAVVFIILSLILPVSSLFAAPGVDGILTVNAADVVLNRYSAVTALSGNVVTVSDINELADGGAGHYANESLSAGDMILIYQAQGASFTDNSNSSTYGAFAYNSSGHYEFAVVAGVAGNNITVDATNNAPYSCGGITNNYDVVNGNVQVVRVPQYASLTVNNGGSVTAEDWDGVTGGIIALMAEGAVVINGLIDAVGSGFRGGRWDEDSYDPNIFVQSYRESNGFYGAVKGESILGEDAEYYLNGGPYGRGAPANGGGGGNAHNSGGGGGANGNNGGTWTGAGLPDTSDSSWANAWDMDDTIDNLGTPLPAYFSGGAGGGRGGYSYSDLDQDATVLPPQNFGWGGNLRLNVGGRGGRPLNNDPATRLFFGGGGGAGEDNNDTGTPGASGGGLVIIVSDSLSGSGEILADGNDAVDVPFEYQDGAGGGGGGGGILIKTGSVSGLTLSATGGDGGDIGILGDPTPFPNEVFGPGGGGGGGYIAVNSASGSPTTMIAGGANGITAAEAMDEFIPNGATGGYSGAFSTAEFALPGCSSPTAIMLAGTTFKAGQVLWLLPVFLLMLALTWVVMIRRPVSVQGHE